MLEKFGKYEIVEKIGEGGLRRGLQGLRPRLETPRRRQDLLVEGPPVLRTLPARSRDRRPASTPQRHHGPRLRLPGRHALSRPGTPERRRSRRQDPARRAPGLGSQARISAPDRRRPRLCPRPGRHPPRRQTRQRPRARRRSSEDHGLRHRQAHRLAVRPHPDRHDHRHRRLHTSRTSPGRQRRPPGRRLRLRRPGLRVAHLPPAFHRPLALRGALPGGPRRARTGHRDLARMPGRPGQPGRCLPRKRSEPACERLLGGDRQARCDGATRPETGGPHRET